MYLRVSTSELTSCCFSHTLILEEYQKLCIQIPDGNGGGLIPGRVPGSPDLPGIYPVPYPHTPGQGPGVVPGQIPIQGPGHVPGQVPIPGQIPGQYPQYPGQLPIQPAPGMLLLSACVCFTLTLK